MISSTMSVKRAKIGESVALRPLDINAVQEEAIRSKIKNTVLRQMSQKDKELFVQRAMVSKQKAMEHNSEAPMAEFLVEETTRFQGRTDRYREGVQRSNVIKTAKQLEAQGQQVNELKNLFMENLKEKEKYKGELQIKEQ